MIQERPFPWNDEFFSYLSAPPKKFGSILEVADFIGVDRKWVPPHVQDWSRLWNEEKYFQVMASVGHLKSNWVFLEIVKELLNDPSIRILFGSESDDLAAHMTMRVKEALTCQAVKNEFGDMRGKKWTDKELFLKGRTEFIKGANFESVGMKSAVEGERFDLCFLDDPVALKITLSKAERGYSQEWIDKQIWPRLDWQRGARILIIGSHWSPLDLYNYIEDKHKVTKLIFPAHGTDYKDILWPQEHTKETLEDIRMHTPEPTYQLRYLCNPEGMSGKGFKLEWITDALVDKNEIPWKHLLINQGWDLAITEKETVGIGSNVKSEPDYTCGIVIGRDQRTGDFYLIDMYLDRIVLGHDDVIESFYKRYPKTQSIGIETNQFQKLVYHLVKAKESAPPAVEVGHYSMDKLTRIRNLEPYFKNKQIHIVKDLPNLEELYAEYMAFPTEGAHDDILDALEIAIKLYVSNQVHALGDYMKWL